ncbi:MAG: hypothetical protein AB8B55_13080 [Mariniblastus sp.]
MKIYDLRDPDDAKQYLLQGLLLSAAAPITKESLHQTLLCAMEIVSDGSPLPCVGLVGDVGMVALGLSSSETNLENLQGIERDPTIIRQYEDYVLGKFYADMSFERASDAISSYEGRDQRRGVAYIVNQIRERSNLGGAVLSLAAVKSLVEIPPDELLAAAIESVQENGWSESLMAEFKEMIFSIRNTGELLGSEDVFELEHGTALAEFGQRVALRQVLRTAAEMEQRLPKQRPSVPARKYSVATNIMEEDFYPIGGFTSISNRGTMESLLRSELAYLDDSGERPDLFDIKYVRDELLYYARDDNQFLRRRLSFLFLLDASLVTARFKDADMPLQRIVLMLAFLVTAIRKLLDWLSNEAIEFELLFVESIGVKQLTDEQTLLETLFREEIASGVVVVRTIKAEDLDQRCDEQARRSLCHVVELTSNPNEILPKGEFAVPSCMIFDASSPMLKLEDAPQWRSEDIHIDAWHETVARMMRFLL